MISNFFGQPSAFIGIFQNLFSAELSLAQTKRNELLALVLLYKALGGGWRQ